MRPLVDIIGDLWLFGGGVIIGLGIAYGELFGPDRPWFTSLCKGAVAVCLWPMLLPIAWVICLANRAKAGRK